MMKKIFINYLELTDEVAKAFKMKCVEQDLSMKHTLEVLVEEMFKQEVQDEEER